MVKDLIIQCGGEEFESPHLRYKLSYLGYLGDLIK
jgi:hypothetical protein